MRAAHPFSLIVLVGTVLLTESQEHHKFFPDEASLDPSCRNPRQDKELFCFHGIHFPTFGDHDVIEIYHMLTVPQRVKPFNMQMPQHAGMGIRNVKTWTNYTLHTYPVLAMSGLMQPTHRDGRLVWCNQAASCLEHGLSEGFNQTGAERTLVATTNGQIFNTFARWVLRLNRTTTEFDLYNSWETKDGPSWTDGWDCGGFVRLCFQTLHTLGVRFVPDFTPKYWLDVIYTKQPVWVGNDTTIFGPDGNKTVAKELIHFYKHLGPMMPVFRHHTYFYFNRAYWRAELSGQGFGVDMRTMAVPLPGNQ